MDGGEGLSDRGERQTTVQKRRASKTLTERSNSLVIIYYPIQNTRKHYGVYTKFIQQLMLGQLESAVVGTTDACRPDS
jgi:hypothetical protein